MNELEAAWCAGFLDGEGWLGLDTHGTPTIEAAQVATREPLDRLARAFGGKVTKRSNGWRWRLSSAPAVRVAILTLHGHMSVKREKAEALLDCAILIRPRGAQRLAPEEMLLRAAASERLLEVQWQTT